MGGLGGCHFGEIAQRTCARPCEAKVYHSNEPTGENTSANVQWSRNRRSTQYIGTKLLQSLLRANMPPDRVPKSTPCAHPVQPLPFGYQFDRHRAMRNFYTAVLAQVLCSVCCSCQLVFQLGRKLAHRLQWLHASQYLPSQGNNLTLWCSSATCVTSQGPVEQGCTAVHSLRTTVPCIPHGSGQEKVCSDGHGFHCCISTPCVCLGGEISLSPVESVGSHGGNTSRQICNRKKSPQSSFAPPLGGAL